MWSLSISYGSGSGTQNGDDGQFILAGLTGNLIVGFGIFGLVLLGGVLLISIVMCIDCMRKRAKVVDLQDDLEEDASEDITKEEVLKEVESLDQEDELDSVSVDANESLKEEVVVEVIPEEEEQEVVEVGHSDDNEAGAAEPLEAEEEDDVPIVPNEDKLEVESIKESNDNEELEETTIEEILESVSIHGDNEKDGKLSETPGPS